jgi:hypothetical protein
MLKAGMFAEIDLWKKKYFLVDFGGIFTMVNL